MHVPTGNSFIVLFLRERTANVKKPSEERERKKERWREREKGEFVGKTVVNSNNSMKSEKRNGGVERFSFKHRLEGFDGL